VPDEVVGRGAELAAVERFVERAGSRLVALVLEGEPGIGKTTIWEAAVDAASASGFCVLRSRPARSEQGLTLGGLTDLFEGDSPWASDTSGRVPERRRRPQRYGGKASGPLAPCRTV
jgi:hypothetical protein